MLKGKQKWFNNIFLHILCFLQSVIDDLDSFFIFPTYFSLIIIT